MSPVRNYTGYDKPTAPGQYWCRPWGEDWQVVKVDWFEFGPFAKKAIVKMMLGYQKPGDGRWWMMDESAETWGPEVELPEVLGDE